MRLSIRIVPALAWGAAIFVSAWVLTEQVRRYAQPGEVVLAVESSAEPQQAAEAIASRHLMGEAAVAELAALAGRFVLLALVTGSHGHPGWALMSIDGGVQQAYVEGDPISDGIKLERIAADHVELSLGGSRQMVQLTAPGAEGGSPVDPGKTPAPAALTH